jgi:hypothetical protein
MKNRPAETLKQVAIELSALISAGNPDNRHMEELFSQLVVNASLPVQPPQEETGPANSNDDAIGIWNKKLVNEKIVFHRDTKKREIWPLWADVREIGPRKEGKRIVLLGESVARGYFFDPHYTVAKELGALLSQLNEYKDVEVIDLAKTSIMEWELLLLAEQCVQLTPDAVVIFAGNNWLSSVRTSFYDDGVFEEIAAVFGQGSFPGVKTYLEQRFEAVVTGILGKIESLLVKKGIQVVFVIPDYNLADWKSDDVERNLLWLKDGERTEWIEKREQAEASLRSGNYPLLKEAASRMVELDSSNPYSHELLGEYYLYNKDWEKANECFEQARDSVIVSRASRTKPRSFQVIRRTILSQAAGFGIKVVDLPAIFRTTDSPVPGRALFLDYCHMSVLGIKLSMLHTAGALLTSPDDKPYDISVLKDSGVSPDPIVEGVAHFCAAIHNSHYGQSAGILKYHCKKAIGYSKELAGLMLKFVDFSTRLAGSRFCKAFEESMMEGYIRQYEGGMGLLHPKGLKVMDAALADTIIEALEEVGIHHKEEFYKLRLHEHEVGEEKLNLLQSYYSTSHYNEFVVPSTQLFKRIRTTEHTFMFVTGSNDTGFLDFSFSYRTPGRYCAEKKIFISVNGTENKMVELPMSKEWVTHRFRINNKGLKDGVNTLIINWPYTYQPLEIKEEFSIESFLDSIYPVLGEIFSLTVTANKSVA